MRKFIIRTLLFLAFMFVIDRMAGTALHCLSIHPRGGMTLHRNHLTNQITEDVLVMGSSRARYHYDPKVVTEMTDLSCFNCGEDGHGIMLFYAWWKLISQRYYPKLIIYDISPQYDLFKGDNHRYLGLLRRFYDDREEIKALFYDVDCTEKWKMLCQMYRYNSTFMELIADYVYPFTETTSDGFIPIDQVIKPKKEYDKPRFSHTLTFDSLKLSYFDKFIQEKGPTKLVFVASPIFDGMNTEAFTPAIDICKKYNIPFYDFSNDPRFMGVTKYFRDTNHLNVTGAATYTRLLMEKLIEEGCLKENSAP
ncbi:MAG: hypothetical protein J5548_13295 [Prevotella sp.]|nr:hypothetical protein [Prevotella sp.]